jgi:hypothetical protein
MDADPVDLGRVLRERVEALLDPAEVVVARPIACEFADRRELDALRAVGLELLGGESGGVDAPLEVVERFGPEGDLERLDLSGALRLGERRHLNHPAVCLTD